MSWLTLRPGPMVGRLWTLRSWAVQPTQTQHEKKTSDHTTSRKPKRGLRTTIYKGRHARARGTCAPKKVTANNQSTHLYRRHLSIEGLLAVGEQQPQPLHYPGRSLQVSRELGDRPRLVLHVSLLLGRSLFPRNDEQRSRHGIQDRNGESGEVCVPVVRGG